MDQPKPAGKAPQMEQLEAGKTYAWCACGVSSNQPWCNGAHKGTDFSPDVFKAETSSTAAMCMCKQTKNPPYCDGSHSGL
jgi:CDGSH-type Zn-finger protein